MFSSKFEMFFVKGVPLLESSIHRFADIFHKIKTTGGIRIQEDVKMGKDDDTPKI